jgi:chromosome segregation ATPase
MSLLDSYNQNEENSESSGDEARQKADEASRSRARRNEIDRQIAILNADLKKVMLQISDSGIQRRKFKKMTDRIRVEVDMLDKSDKKLDNDRRILEEEIQKLKKELKILQ